MMKEQITQTFQGLSWEPLRTARESGVSAGGIGLNDSGRPPAASPSLWGERRSSRTIVELDLPADSPSLWGERRGFEARQPHSDLRTARVGTI
jgi:hypothetical protein